MPGHYLRLMQSSDTVATARKHALQLRPPNIHGTAVVRVQADEEGGRFPREVFRLRTKPMFKFGRNII